jgi:hypothetical protein
VENDQLSSEIKLLTRFSERCFSSVGGLMGLAKCNEQSDDLGKSEFIHTKHGASVGMDNFSTRKKPKNHCSLTGPALKD